MFDNGRETLPVTLEISRTEAEVREFQECSKQVKADSGE